MQRTPKILIIRFSSIGDIVLTSPVVRVLAEQMDPSPEIHFLTKASFAFLLADNPHIHKVHTIEKATAEVMDELKELDFDYIIDLHRNVRSSMVKRGLKRLDFTLKKYNWEKWLLVRFGIDRMPDKHIVDRYLDTLKAFGLENDGKGLDYFYPESEKVGPQKALPSGTSQYIALALGGAHVGKRMRYDLLEGVIDQCDAHFCLLGGKEDAELGQRLHQRFPDKTTDLSGKISVHGSASILEQAEMVISGDTGMMHIASAFGKDIISVWGCTSPRFGMNPHNPNGRTQIIEPKGLSKRPCSKLGDCCKYGKEKRCIDHIEPSQIVEAVTRLRTTS